MIYDKHLRDINFTWKPRSKEQALNYHLRACNIIFLLSDCTLLISALFYTHMHSVPPFWQSPFPNYIPAHSCLPYTHFSFSHHLQLTITFPHSYIFTLFPHVPHLWIPHSLPLPAPCLPFLLFPPFAGCFHLPSIIPYLSTSYNIVSFTLPPPV